MAIPLTPETEGLIDAHALEAMKSTAFLINVARGAIIDEKALYQALKEGQIAGAAIDTWYQYPGSDAKRMPASLPFHMLDNVIMTPHTSGETVQTVAARTCDIADNINRLISDEQLHNIVYP